MHLGPFGLNRLPNLHLELFLGQIPPEATLIDELRPGPARPDRQRHPQVRVLSAYQPRLRGLFTYPEPFDRT